MSISVPIQVYNENQELLGFWAGGVIDLPSFEVSIWREAYMPDSVRFKWHQVDYPDHPAEIVWVLEVSMSDYERLVRYAGRQKFLPVPRGVRMWEV